MAAAQVVKKASRSTIEKVAALAALMPIVASMGGIAGTQTVTLIIRGLALGQVPVGECALAAVQGDRESSGLNGIIWAIVVGAVTVVWFDTWTAPPDHLGSDADEPARGRCLWV